jgi:hypothetical protein
MINKISFALNRHKKLLNGSPMLFNAYKKDVAETIGSIQFGKAAV